MIRRDLLDVNVLIALTNTEHARYTAAQRWYDTLRNEEWGICPFSEAGYIRIVTNPITGPIVDGFIQAVAILRDLAQQPGFFYWPIAESWAELTAPFARRISGHQQVTDAYLLGLAIKNNGVLVTFDHRIRYLAGQEYSKNLLVLE